jgi:predicted kinase
MSGPKERRRAVDLCSATPMTTAQVVEHLGYPTRRCLERWLAKDPRYAGHMVVEIAYENGWIVRDELMESATCYGKSQYGRHLEGIADGEIILVPNQKN